MKESEACLFSSLLSREASLLGVILASKEIVDWQNRKKKDMKFQKKKDIKRRNAYCKYEMKRIFSKYLLSQTSGSSSKDDAKTSTESLLNTEVLSSL